MLKSYLKQDNVAPTPTQHYLVWIRLQRKTSFVTSFTISNWIKKYYYMCNMYTCIGFFIMQPNIKIYFLVIKTHFSMLKTILLICVKI